MSLRIETNPIRASLLAAAVACLEGRAEHWHCTAALPCEDAFRVADHYTHTHEDSADQSPEEAATYCLLVDAAEHGPLPH